MITAIHSSVTIEQSVEWHVKKGFTSLSKIHAGKLHTLQKQNIEDESLRFNWLDKLDLNCMGAKLTPA